MAEEHDFTPVQTFSELVNEGKELCVDFDAPLTDTERSVVDWQYKRYGSFFSKLFDAFVCADGGNLVNLYRAFPEQVLGYVAYGHNLCWWPDVVEKAKAQGKL